LLDFDVVAIVNVEVIPFTENILFPESEVLNLKKRLQETSLQKDIPIVFIGINSSVPESHYLQQAKLFDGLFIGADTPIEKRKSRRKTNGSAEARVIYLFCLKLKIKTKKCLLSSKNAGL
jgi:hypothetical protein